MTPSVTMRNTKSQIMDAYTALLADFDAMQARAKSAEKQARSGARSTQKVAPSPAAAKAGTDEMNIAVVLGQLDSLKQHFGGAASDISGKLTAEATQLAALNGEIDERLAQLKLLHGIEVGDDPIAVVQSILGEHCTLSDSFQETHTERVSAFDADLAEKQEAWKRELSEHNRTVKARNTELSKQRKREQAQYDYALKQARQLEAEENAAAKAAREKELSTHIAAQRKAWETREADLAEREEAVAEARAEAEGLDDRLEKARKQATEEGTSIARRQAKVKADRLEKQVEGDKRVLEMEIGALTEQITSQEARIKHLNAQIEATLKQTQDLAVQSIKGAEQASSFETLKRIAIEQARTSAKGK